MLSNLGIGLLEIAPTRYWPDLAEVSESQASLKASELNNQGFSICAFQALLFGKPELQLFGTDDSQAFMAYVKHIGRIAHWMGAQSLVFGSPKNRLRKGLSTDEAFKRAAGIFCELGEFFAPLNVVLCLEPNPSGYGADFLTTADEVDALVRAVDSPGIAMNFDMGEVIMNAADPAVSIRKSLRDIGHFHVSEPMLAPFQREREEHHIASRLLKESNYNGIISVEMKTPEGGLSVVRKSVQAVMDIYGG